MQGSLRPQLSQRAAFWAVTLIIAGIFAIGSTALVWWIIYRLRELDTRDLPSPAPAYVDYSISGSYTSTEQWKEAQAGYQQYVQQNPQPKNVQILTGWSTAQVYAYMVSQVSGGLKVSCQYCHVINAENGWDFSLDTNPQKIKARQMMVMAADLNRNFISRLPPNLEQQQGHIQVTCATCHNGQPVFSTYPDGIQVTQPAGYRLPLDLAFPGGLEVTGRTDKGLEDVALNQYTMYHMNVSLGQGCTFCHNARYFPSYERPQKYHAGTMILMSQHLAQGTYPYSGDASYGNPDALPAVAVDPAYNAIMNGQTYLSIMNNKTPSCWMCHQNNWIPPGGAKEGQAPEQIALPPATQ